MYSEVVQEPLPLKQKTPLSMRPGVILTPYLGQKKNLSVAHLQNEIVPENILIRYEKGFEKRETIRNVTTKFKAPLRPLENSSPALF